MAFVFAELGSGKGPRAPEGRPSTGEGLDLGVVFGGVAVNDVDCCCSWCHGVVAVILVGVVVYECDCRGRGCIVESTIVVGRGCDCDGGFMSVCDVFPKIGMTKGLSKTPD